MKYYVVSDVHGYYTHLENALREAGFFDETLPCKLVVCGDLLDRGTEAPELIDFMLRLMEEDRLIYIKGNHEELLVDCLQDISRGDIHRIAGGMSHHYRNKTWHTLLQISGLDEMTAYKAPDELIRRVMRSPFYSKLLPTCVDFYETPNYIFVHGWLPCFSSGLKPFVNYRYNPNWRAADLWDWYSARWLNGMALACEHHVIETGKTVVCGHWHTSYGHAELEGKGTVWGEGADFSPFSAEGILAIDACTAYSGRVNCVVLED